MKKNVKINKRNGKMFLFLLVLAALLGIFATSGIAFALELNEYQSAEAEYAAINENIVVADDEFEIEEESVVEPATAVVEEAADGVEVESVPEIDYPAVDINFEKLTSVNADVLGVIYIPTLDLKYPVVQGADNEYYLHHTVEGTENASGSVFVDYRANSDLSDNNTFVYAHNMKNGTMFGSLKQFLYNENLCESDPYIYLYLAGGTVMKYHIFSYGVVSVNDNLYYSFDDAAYDEYVAQAQARSSYAGEQTDDFSTHPNLLTLSTCFGTEHVENFVVQAAFVGSAIAD